MIEDRGWMDVGWKKGGAHTKERMKEFLYCAFSLSNNHDMKCPCSRCRNDVCEDDRMGVQK
jgi:hypothetical protein